MKMIIDYVQHCEWYALQVAKELNLLLQLLVEIVGRLIMPNMGCYYQSRHAE